MISVYSEDICGEPVMLSDVVYPEVWRDEILRLAQITGVPITAYVEEVKVGKGLPGLGVKPISCVVVAHKDSPGKYVKIVGALSKMGNLTFTTGFALLGEMGSLGKRLIISNCTSFAIACEKPIRSSKLGRSLTRLILKLKSSAFPYWPA